MCRTYLEWFVRVVRHGLRKVWKSSLSWSQKSLGCGRPFLRFHTADTTRLAKSLGVTKRSLLSAFLIRPKSPSRKK